MTEQEDSRKLKELREGIAEWLWHFDGHATSFDLNPVKHRTFWFNKADSLLRTVLAPYFIDMGELTELGGKDISQAVIDLKGAKMPTLFSYRHAYFIGAKAARAKFVSIGQFLGDGKQ